MRRRPRPKRVYLCIRGRWQTRRVVDLPLPDRIYIQLGLFPPSPPFSKQGR